ncbi:50S ribosomal protein L5 [Candidatus Jorgensenbacteria bacterium CG_4_10_14_0_8_um_filter_39_13]|uniref:50S ribosomal protein L5 n=2 Tax=Candidatus Joergenseniibacteriota TaxID=1752739 RepID=A0A2M7RH22_9BACT|nr:MAG: 50S ribosomal protein L5 [Candidatus Jorgensenbacteria bacterium CG11_big_fil_rev_8_21_14_0_20_38_23]PIV13196.1 MAG: 50S ribosomal protein L5 [Candidatus Jorgensenbacteria bacterium CG03_land_8_20_14_0_80_38_39]PIY96033.1 MAG: 50S ribosomal protein L5 [Candidatus Jorgensenbacteria bacterium CG_4_10_14_0_8_um_filter_39_13]PJA94946.1 MAG: 50S ribosomal protein L5 [Candidatus Jorgensenbacteria bacterium CG_4_9_14_3_um_filter_38_10]
MKDNLQENFSSKIEKVVVSIGVGKLRLQNQFEEKILPEITKETALLTGQKPTLRRAKKSIAGFKSRTGDIIGLQVTLRRRRLWDFLAKIIHIVLPRVKDFRGLDLKNIDSGGNLNIGFREQFVFPEINPEQSKVDFGLQITIIPALRKREEAIDLYRRIGIPLKK